MKVPWPTRVGSPEYGCCYGFTDSISQVGWHLKFVKGSPSNLQIFKFNFSVNFSELFQKGPSARPPKYATAQVSDLGRNARIFGGIFLPKSYVQVHFDALLKVHVASSSSVRKSHKFKYQCGINFILRELVSHDLASSVPSKPRYVSPHTVVRYRPIQTVWLRLQNGDRRRQEYSQ